MENGPFEDVFTSKEGDIPLLCYFTKGQLTFHTCIEAVRDRTSWTWHHQNSHIERIQKSIDRNPTSWAPTSYTWTYNLYKWPYKWVTEVTSPIKVDCPI